MIRPVLDMSVSGAQRFHQANPRGRRFCWAERRARCKRAGDWFSAERQWWAAICQSCRGSRRFVFFQDAVRELDFAERNGCSSPLDGWHFWLETARFAVHGAAQTSVEWGDVWPPFLYNTRAAWQGTSYHTPWGDSYPFKRRETKKEKFYLCVRKRQKFGDYWGTLNCRIKKKNRMKM